MLRSQLMSAHTSYFPKNILEIFLNIQDKSQSSYFGVKIIHVFNHLFSPSFGFQGEGDIPHLP
ncbi:MAG: hypothetical protein ACKPGT_31380, partial [Microcystis sp.]